MKNNNLCKTIDKLTDLISTYLIQLNELDSNIDSSSKNISKTANKTVKAFDELEDELSNFHISTTRKGLEPLKDELENFDELSDKILKLAHNADLDIQSFASMLNAYIGIRNIFLFKNYKQIGDNISTNIKLPDSFNKIRNKNKRSKYWKILTVFGIIFGLLGFLHISFAIIAAVGGIILYIIETLYIKYQFSPNSPIPRNIAKNIKSQMSSIKLVSNITDVYIERIRNVKITWPKSFTEIVNDLSNGIHVDKNKMKAEKDLAQMLYEITKRHIDKMDKDKEKN